jgi:hypothetical protein
MAEEDIEIRHLNPIAVPSRSDFLAAQSSPGAAGFLTPEQILSLLLPADVPFTPAGGLLATKVQAAIVELAGRVALDPTTVGRALASATSKAAGRLVIDAAPLSKAYGFGCSLSNNGGNPNTHVDVAAGEWASDGATPFAMTLASAITKRLDAVWAVGTGNGGLDTGAKAPSTWYYVFEIQRSDTGVTDICFSASSSGPAIGANIPVAYDRKRRLPGAVLTDASGNIRAFKMVARLISFAAPIENFSGTTRTLALLTISAPTGIDTRATAQLTVTGTTGATLYTYQLGSGNQPSPPVVTVGTNISANGIIGGVGPSDLVAVSGQIYYGGGGANSTAKVITLGFEDVAA